MLNISNSDSKGMHGGKDFFEFAGTQMLLFLTELAKNAGQISDIFGHFVQIIVGAVYLYNLIIQIKERKNSKNVTTDDKSNGTNKE